MDERRRSRSVGRQPSFIRRIRGEGKAAVMAKLLLPAAALLALLLLAVVGAFLVFDSFRDPIPHDPEEAREALDARTVEEVAAGREQVEEIEKPLIEEPPAREEAAAPEVDTTTEQAVTAATTLPPSDEAPIPDSIANSHSPELPDRMFDAVVLIGADASGFLADSIILLLFPEGGSAPAMVSIPRDLYLYNLCSEDYRRVNANLGGCPGYANGSELLALALHEFTGVEVDHYVRVDFDGFVELIDGLGGVGICIEHPTHDEKAGLDVPAPTCHLDGRTALAYARSRNATQLIEGEWRQAWSSDFARQEHQRELLLALARQTQSASFGTILSTLQGLSHTVRLDSAWSLPEAVEWVWRYRDFDPSEVTQFTIPVEDYRTPEGAQVLIPARSFNDVLSRWWGPAQR